MTVVDETEDLHRISIDVSKRSSFRDAVVRRSARIAKSFAQSPSTSLVRLLNWWAAMKKTKQVKLTVNVEAIRALSDVTLANVQGARNEYSQALYWNCSGARICAAAAM